MYALDSPENFNLYKWERKLSYEKKYFAFKNFVKLNNFQGHRTVIKALSSSSEN